MRDTMVLILTGPIIVACHWNMLSPVGPALQEEGGSRPRSINSYKKIQNPSSVQGPDRLDTAVADEG